jgi:hypothetical protein
MPVRAALAALLGACVLIAPGCRNDAGPRPAGDPAASAGEPPALVFEDPEAPEGFEDPGGAATPEEPPGTDTVSIVLPDSDVAPPAPVPLGGLVGSCDVRAAEGLCFAFTGPGWTAAAAQAECARAGGGVFQSALCPTDDRVGECVYRPDGDAAREIVSTFYAPMDPLVAEAVCRGTFRAL